MANIYRLHQNILQETFAHFRSCGCGRRECQVLWISPWDAPETITRVIHPLHESHFGGFELDNKWLNDFWFTLARESMGVRVQVHTHPAAAFHSPTDDAFPIIHTTGFLSLVIPNFAFGEIGMRDAYLAEMQAGGRWSEVTITERLVPA